MIRLIKSYQSYHGVIRGFVRNMNKGAFAVSDEIKRYVFAGAAAVMMVLSAELLGEREIIFPEVAALLIGAWVRPRQPWRVSRAMLVFLMTLSALCGVCIVRYLPVHLYLQLLAAFVFIAGALILSKTTLAPLISACVLPVLLHTTSLIYPLSVFVCALVITAVQSPLQSRGLIENNTVFHTATNLREELFKWSSVLVLLLLLCALPVFTNKLYFIAPPLIVIFVELCDTDSPVRASSKRLLVLASFAAVLGTGARLLLCGVLHLPLSLCAAVIVSCLFWVLHKVEMLLPPLGAIAFLPLILPLEGLWRYPLEVSVGTAVFVLAALYAFPFRKKAEKPREELSI